MLNRTSDQSRLRRRASVVAILAGIVASTVSLTAIAAADRPDGAVAAAGPTTITLGPEDISVVRQVYDPGEDSGWHAHSGIHAVAVLSGTLTVYDPGCRGQAVEPDRPYVGGQEMHRVRNETAEAVEMVVSYLSPRAAADSNRPVAKPACALT